MQRLQAYKFELIVTGEQQQRQMRRFSGACRFVYNKAEIKDLQDKLKIVNNYL